MDSHYYWLSWQELLNACWTLDSASCTSKYIVIFMHSHYWHDGGCTLKFHNGWCIHNELDLLGIISCKNGSKVHCQWTCNYFAKPHTQRDINFCWYLEINYVEGRLLLIYHIRNNSFFRPPLTFKQVIATCCYNLFAIMKVSLEKSAIRIKRNSQ